MKDTSKYDEIMKVLKNEKTFDDAKIQLLPLLRSQLDYLLNKKSKLWKFNKLLTGLIFTLLCVASIMIFIGLFQHTVMLWVVCAGLWLTREINAPMKKYLAYATISIKAYNIINDIQYLENKRNVNLIERKEFMNAYIEKADSWQVVFFDNDITKIRN